MTNPNSTINPIIISNIPLERGLTKREYFAALALQGGIIAAKGVDSKRIAEYAGVCADDLIEALNKENE